MADILIVDSDSLESESSRRLGERELDWAGEVGGVNEKEGWLDQTR